MNKLIEVKNLKISYESNIVIDNLNFSVLDDDFLCIVGENGSGKTTLIKSILGLIKFQGGTIKFSNMSHRNIGYIPQDTTVSKKFPASVNEIVLSGTLNSRHFSPIYNAEQKKKAEDSLALLKITELKNRPFSELSGGQRQKVLVARALSATSKLLILDEPSNNLDHNSRHELYNLLRQINKERGIAVIMVTHDLDHSNLIGKHILALRTDGYYYGSVEDYVKVIHHDK